MSRAYVQVYELVCRIPPGKVLTYGLVSHLIGGRLSAQVIGWALKALGPPGGDKPYSAANVPWHRVINSRGQLSTHKNADIPPGLQRDLLEQEGVRFNDEQCVDLDKYLWYEGLPAGKAPARPSSRGPIRQRGSTNKTSS